MRCLIVLALTSAVLAAPRPDGPSSDESDEFLSVSRGYGAPVNQGYQAPVQQSYQGPVQQSYQAPSTGYAACGYGQLRGADGSCGPADVSRSVYVYESPEKQVIYGGGAVVPRGKIHKNVIFIRTPEIVGSNDPIVVPRTQTRTTLYVLSKNGEQGQRVVQFADAPEAAPEVFYVHYNDGENPTLPNGQDLQSALAAASSSLGQSGGYGAAAPARASVALSGGYNAPSQGYARPSGAGVVAATGYTSGVSSGYDLGDDSVELGGNYGPPRQSYN